MTRRDLLMCLACVEEAASKLTMATACADAATAAAITDVREGVVVLGELLSSAYRESLDKPAEPIGPTRPITEGP